MAKPAVSERILRWWLFTGLFALLPLVATYTWTAVQASKFVPLAGVFTHGELFLLASALCAAGTGELIASGDRSSRVGLICGGLSFALVFISGLLFAMFSVTPNSNQSLVFPLSAWI